MSYLSVPDAMQGASDFTDEEILSMYKAIGRNVKASRDKKGMTQLQLSLAMGHRSVSLVSAAELVSDGTHFNLEHLYKISKILNIDISDLFFEPKCTVSSS